MEHKPGVEGTRTADARRASLWGIGGGDDFTFLDGERLIRFGRGALAEAPELIAGRGFGGYTLLTTARTDALRGEAAAVLEVPPGRVDKISAELLPRINGDSVVALGGGRVIDTAKAIAGALGLACAAVPTTLSGAELTPFHRLPKGASGARLTRPALVIGDPALMASQPLPDIAASAMNALAHAVEALYTPLANPVARMAALRAAELLAAGLAGGDPDRDALALGALLAGWASGTTGYAFHHVVCQTIVRVGGTSHAGTNAVMLPHSVRYVSASTPEALAGLAEALGGEPPERIGALTARSGATALAELGFDPSRIDAVIEAVAPRPELRNTPRPPDEDGLRALIEAAL